MKNQIIKKSLGIIGLTTLVVALFINTSTLNSSTPNLSLANLVSLNTANAEWPWDFPWDTDWGLEEDLDPCNYYYPGGGGVFTSSVEITCKIIECVIPLDCDCTPIPCGQV